MHEKFCSRKFLRLRFKTVWNGQPEMAMVASLLPYARVQNPKRTGDSSHYFWDSRDIDGPWTIKIGEMDNCNGRLGSFLNCTHPFSSMILPRRNADYPYVRLPEGRPSKLVNSHLAGWIPCGGRRWKGGVSWPIVEECWPKHQHLRLFHTFPYFSILLLMVYQCRSSSTYESRLPDFSKP